MSSGGVMQRELARQALARNDVGAFAWYTMPQYRIARPHRLLAAKLAEVERYIVSGGREGIGRLMVFMPPRHGKSELISVRFPAWFLGRNPSCRVIEASCTADLAIGFSRKTRDVIRDEPFQVLFGAASTLPKGQWVQMSEESRAADEWEIAGHSGGLKAAGVGGSIIGRGMHLGIIDDPFKNRFEAESKRVRDEVDTWYKEVFYSRLEPGGAIVLMHQRWHADDLAGRLLKRMVSGEPDMDQWDVVCLPAIAEEWAQQEIGREDWLRACRDGWWKASDPLGRAAGEALWRGKYDEATMATIRSNAGLYGWNSMYQQRPLKMEGAQIRAGAITRIDAAPPDVTNWVRAWDLAVSGRETADWLVGALVGRTNSGRTVIRHIKRLRGPWADAKAEMIEVMRGDGVEVQQVIETGGQQGGYCQELQRDQRLAGLSVVGIRPAGNKEQRAQVWASRIPDGLVYLVDDGSWNVDEFISEATMFPNGAHDDQVDAVSLAVQALANVSGWASYARQQIEKWRAEGRKIPSVARPWLEGEGTQMNADERGFDAGQGV